MGTLLGCVALMASLGFPTIFALTMWCVKACKRFFKELTILQKAQKAQMRSQLLEQFHKYERQGWISEDDLLDWINQHKAYHELVGDNGVLEARKDALINMPSYPAIEAS